MSNGIDGQCVKQGVITFGFSDETFSHKERIKSMTRANWNSDNVKLWQCGIMSNVTAQRNHFHNSIISQFHVLAINLII